MKKIAIVALTLMLTLGITAMVTNDIGVGLIDVDAFPIYFNV